MVTLFSNGVAKWRHKRNNGRGGSGYGDNNAQAVAING